MAGPPYGDPLTLPQTRQKVDPGKFFQFPNNYRELLDTILRTQLRIRLFANLELCCIT